LLTRLSVIQGTITFLSRNASSPHSTHFLLSTTILLLLYIHKSPSRTLKHNHRVMRTLFKRRTMGMHEPGTFPMRLRHAQQHGRTIHRTGPCTNDLESLLHLRFPRRLTQCDRLARTTCLQLTWLILCHQISSPLVVPNIKPKKTQLLLESVLVFANESGRSIASDSCCPL
jgi:hypothetical protein